MKTPFKVLISAFLITALFYVVVLFALAGPKTGSVSKDLGITFDGSTSVISNVLALNTLVYSFTDDIDSFTMASQGTKSLIFLDGDNDSDNDEIDLQNGTVNGQIVIFIVKQDCDDDDTIAIDAEEDSTCTGCPNSGVFTFDDPGDMVILVWYGSSWFYLDSYAVD